MFLSYANSLLLSKWRLGALFIFFAITLVGLYSCSKKDEIYTIKGRTMGTTWSAKVVLPGKSKLPYQEVQQIIQKQLDQVDSLASTWKPNSEVSRFNASKKYQYVKVSPIIFQAVQRAKYWYYHTNRNFNITLEPLIKAWGFDNIEVQHPPSAATIAKLLQRVGVRYLRTYPKTHSLRKTKQGLEINLSGIIKGYAVDLVAKKLLKAGISNFLIEVGGEVYVHGHRPDGNLWSVGIANPSIPQQYYSTLQIHNKGIATSGNYMNYYIYKNKRYTHIIASSTGYPIAVQNALSVTVVMPTTEAADAIATAMIVYGIDIGISVANRNHWPVYFLIATKKKKDGLPLLQGYASKAYLKLTKEPIKDPL